MGLNFQVSVKDLVERVVRSGDIHFRFSSRSNATEGIKGHQTVQKKRPANYQAERSLSKTITLDELSLTIRGRADGCILTASELMVEEIKTLRVAPEKIPDAVKKLHWAQLQIYGCLIAQEEGMPELTLRLTYYDYERDTEYSFDDNWQTTALASHCELMFQQYITFLRAIAKWRSRRNVTIDAMLFPYGEFRPGQREMAVSTYRTLKEGGQLVLQAPTGIGKTIAGIFPAIKAIKELGLGKVFYLSAKGSGQEMARRAVADLRGGGLQLRDITLTAKEKVCLSPGMPCDPEFCQYAKGYYDKLPAVVEEVMERAVSLDKANIESLALEHKVCPFELSLDLSEVSDVVICDYNYVFDPTVYLRRYFDDKPEPYVMLMDEAHNLVDRGRDMFSAELSKQSVLALRRDVKQKVPEIYRALGKVNKVMLDIIRPWQNDLPGGVSLEKFPRSLAQALKRFTETTESWLDQNHTTGNLDNLLPFYFDALRFQRVLDEATTEDYAYLIASDDNTVRFKLFCLNPAPGLGKGFSRMAASLCFSATLSPQVYFQSLMGVAEDAKWYQIPSPYLKENLGVFTTGYLSTTYKNRQQSLYELIDTLASVVRAKSGNYLVYFPSYAYLTLARDKFVERYPGIEVISQQPGMADSDREHFLERFSSSALPVLGFAVMGGIFGEGIDLKGSRLIGAIIVGVGLPQLGIERNLIRDLFDRSMSGAGFEFAYQYPGMNRVLQTAGRVIRSETDRGVICLIDHRFNESRYRTLFPESWSPQCARNRARLEVMLAEFWSA